MVEYSRSYYHDRETGLYYLNARYYNPQWRRFISPDSTEYIDPESPNGLNLYCYCGNDPVNYADPSGHIAFWLACGLVLGAAGLIGGATYAGIQSYEVGNRGWDLVGSIALGAIAGGVTGFAAGALIGLSAASVLAGSFGASCGQAYLGLKGLMWAFNLGGPGAALSYMMYNFCRPIHVSYSWIGYFPPNNGFAGNPTTITLEPGTVIQRIGGDGGIFVSPFYTSPMSLSLPYAQLPNMHNMNLFVVNEPLTVLSGYAAAWFGQIGGGVQYVLPQAIAQLLELGILSRM